MPEWAKSADICNVPKKGDDLHKMANYRPIALIPTIIKIVGTIVIQRVYRGLEDAGWFAREQAGFRNKQEGIAQVAALYEIAQRRANKGLKTYMLFVDFKNAYP